MNIFTAPFYALFSRDFYAQISRSSVKKGLLYLLYLSGIMTVLFAGIMLFVVFPQADKFMAWAAKEMPTLVLSEQGFSMKEQSPYTLSHEEFGPVAVFDVSKDEIKVEEMGDVFVYVTKKNIYLRQQNQTRIYPVSDLTGQNPNLKEGAQFDGQSVEKFYGTIKPLALGLTVLFVFVFYWIWKLVAAAVYSLAALIFNALRSEKLDYGRLLNVTIFAMTPAILFQWLRLAIPALGTIRFISALDILLTVTFLYYAVKMTEGPSVSSPTILPPAA